MKENYAYVKGILEKGNGILSMVPTWVPRLFNKPGKRLRLHPDDYYAMGMKRGAIVERWFSSITKAVSKDAGEFEGMSFVNTDGNVDHKVLFLDMVELLGEELIGKELMTRYGTWPMYSKLYDYNDPLFHHVHHREEACKKVGVLPKHEHYYFPRQYNNHLGTRPVTYFGFDPSVTKEEVKSRLEKYELEDGRILELSRAFRMELGTGWYTPAGVVHAPASLCTYEPQWNSDVMAMWQNVVEGEIFHYDSLCGYVPAGSERDLNVIMDAADWKLNTIGNYRETFFRVPADESEGGGYRQKWVCYGNDYIGAKELIVEPGAKVVIKDAAAYGCIVVQGRGKFGNFICESPTMIRYGQITADEFFVAHERAKSGVEISNTSPVERLVILKHFGPDCGMPEKK